MKERVRRLARRTCGQSRQQVVEDLRPYLMGWKQYFRLAETPRIFLGLDQWLRHRLRAIQLKQWKRGRTTYRALVARGVNPEVAGQVAAGTRRWWRNSAMAIHQALPNRLFDELGLPRLVA